MKSFLLRTKQTGALLASAYFMAFFGLLSVTAFSINTAILAQDKLKLEQVSEAVTLALGYAGDGLNDADYNAVRDTYLQAFYPDEKQRGKINMQIFPPKNPGDPYRVTASLTSDFYFPGSLQTSSQSVDVNATIAAEKIRDRLEVALVLDVSGSMGSLMGTLRSSSKAFVRELFSNRVDDEQVYISVVPFDAAVNLGNNRQQWLNGSNRCNGEYRNGSNTIEAVLALPTANRFDSSFSCNDMALLPLTNNENRLNQRINSLRASGTTSIDIGLAWGWRTLASGWRGMWVESPQRPLADKVKKAIVVFSDGNGYEDYGRFQQMCNQLNTQEKIEVFAVQFGWENAELKSCAKDLEHYYLADNPQKLQQAFEEISQRIGFELKLKRL